MKMVSILVLFILSGSLNAGDGYKCVIEYAISIDSYPKGDKLSDHLIGEEFTVDRSSGIVTGALKNSYFTKPVIIDSGSSENSFKVVTTMRKEEGVGHGSTISALTIREFDSGPNKSFVFMLVDQVYFGFCNKF